MSIGKQHPSLWFSPARGEKKVKKNIPLTLPLSREVEREKEQNFLKTPLTFVLSRRGREEMKEYPLTLPSPAGWRGEKKEERGLKKNLLN
jgi:hypothetical protein